MATVSQIEMGQCTPILPYCECNVFYSQNGTVPLFSTNRHENRSLLFIITNNGHHSSKLISINPVRDLPSSYRINQTQMISNDHKISNNRQIGFVDFSWIRAAFRRMQWNANGLWGIWNVVLCSRLGCDRFLCKFRLSRRRERNLGRSLFLFITITYQVN